MSISRPWDQQIVIAVFTDTISDALGLQGYPRVAGQGASALGANHSITCFLAVSAGWVHDWFLQYVVCALVVGGPHPRVGKAGDGGQEAYDRQKLCVTRPSGGSGSISALKSRARGEDSLIL